MKDFPVDFQEKVRTPGAANGVGYPYRISALDLMMNFNFAALDADETWIESVQDTLGAGRKLKLPPVPSTDDYVLGCGSGVLRWIESPCQFGRVIDIVDNPTFTKGIGGGVVVCGKNNFYVPFYGINLQASGAWSVYLRIACKSNSDDGGSILLPGIESGSVPQWEKGALYNYPNSTNPVASSGNGTIIVPLGTLTVEDEVASFEATACGHITVHQCAGTLSYTRG